MGEKWSKHLCKYYVNYSFIANALIALGFAGLALLGLLNTILTATALVVWGCVLGGLYALGKLLDQEVDDLDKVRKHKHGTVHLVNHMEDESPADSNISVDDSSG